METKYSVETYLTQKLGEIFIIHFNPAIFWCLEADLVIVTSCEDKMTVVWDHSRSTESAALNEQTLCQDCTKTEQFPFKF